MPTNLTETRKDAFGLESEANLFRSREQVILESGQDLEAGAVLGKITASGKYKEYNPGNSDGSETAVAVLYSTKDASAGDEDVVIIARDAEYNASDLSWFSGATGPQIATGETELAAVGIIARAEGETQDLAEQTA